MKLATELRRTLEYNEEQDDTFVQFVFEHEKNS